MIDKFDLIRDNDTISFIVKNCINNIDVKVLYDSGAVIPVWLNSSLPLTINTDIVKPLNIKSEVNGFGLITHERFPVVTINELKLNSIVIHNIPIVLYSKLDRHFNYDLVLPASLFKKCTILIKNDYTKERSIEFNTDRDIWCRHISNANTLLKVTSFVQDDLSSINISNIINSNNIKGGF